AGVRWSNGHAEHRNYDLALLFGADARRHGTAGPGAVYHSGHSLAMRCTCGTRIIRTRRGISGLGSIALAPASRSARGMVGPHRWAYTRRATYRPDRGRRTVSHYRNLGCD